MAIETKEVQVEPTLSNTDLAHERTMLAENRTPDGLDKNVNISELFWVYYL